MMHLLLHRLLIYKELMMSQMTGLSETSYSGVKTMINKTACTEGQQNLPDIGG